MRVKYFLRGFKRNCAISGPRLQRLHPPRDGGEPAQQSEAHYQQRRVLRAQPFLVGHRRCHGLCVPGIVMSHDFRNFYAIIMNK